MSGFVLGLVVSLRKAARRKIPELEVSTWWGGCTAREAGILCHQPQHLARRV